MVKWDVLLSRNIEVPAIFSTISSVASNILSVEAIRQLHLFVFVVILLIDQPDVYHYI